MHSAALAIHVLAGAGGLGLGPLVLWQERRIGGPRGRSRRRLGTGYRVAVALVCATAVVLVAGWRGDLWWLAPVAVLSAALAELGLRAATRLTRHRAALITHGLGGSYIALFTAFAVVALTVDGPVAGTAALVVWFAPTVLGTIASSVNLLIWAVVSMAATSWVYPWWVWVAGPWGVLLFGGWMSGRVAGNGPERSPAASPFRVAEGSIDPPPSKPNSYADAARPPR